MVPSISRLLSHSLMLVACWGFLVAANSPARAQFDRPSFKYKVGDRVMVEKFGEWIPGRVTEIINDLGWASVDTGDSFPHTYTPDEIRPAKKKTKPAPTTTSDPFATPEERAAQEKPRTWSDASGKFKVEATFLRVEDGKVVLRRADGKEITVPVDRLSEPDREYLAAATGESFDAPDDDSDDDSDSGDEFVPADALEYELTPVLVDNAPLIDPSPSDVWTYSPDAAPPAQTKPVRVALGQVDFHDELEALFLVPSQTKAFAVWKNPFHKSAGRPGRRVVACDWSKKKIEHEAQFFEGQRPMALSADGTRLVAVSDEFGLASGSTVFVYNLVGQEAKLHVAFNPWGTPPKNDGTLASRHRRFAHRAAGGGVGWCEFLDADHLLTSARTDGRLALWDLSAGVEPVYSVKVEGGFLQPSLSANKKYLAFPSEGGIPILEALTGAKAGHLPAEDLFGFPRLAWSADGQKLALATGGRVRVWDLKSRGLYRDFPQSGGFAHDGLAWTDDRRLLLSGRTLVDVELRIPLWLYPQQRGAVAQAEGQLWWVQRDNGREAAAALTTISLPHDEARKLAASLDPEELLVIRPGMELTLEVQIAGSAADRQLVVDILTKKLTAAGFRIAAGPTKLKLVAAIRPGERMEIEYRSFGSFDSTKHTVTPQVMSLTFFLDGKQVWTSGGGGNHPPGILHLERGESVDQALAREMRQNPAWFGGMWVPSWVAVPPAGTGFAPGNNPAAPPGAVPAPVPSPAAPPGAAPTAPPAKERPSPFKPARKRDIDA